MKKLPLAAGLFFTIVTVLLNMKWHEETMNKLAYAHSGSSYTHSGSSMEGGMSDGSAEE